VNTALALPGLCAGRTGASLADCLNERVQCRVCLTLNLVDNVACHRLNMALRVICQDDMGKQAVRDGLKQIKLKNVKDKSSMKMTFDGGVLEMHCAYAQRTDGMFSDNQIRELLTNKL